MFNEEINNILEEIDNLEIEINTKLYNFLIKKNKIKFEDVENLLAKKRFFKRKSIKTYWKRIFKICCNKYRIIYKKSLTYLKIWL